MKTLNRNFLKAVRSDCAESFQNHLLNILSSFDAIDDAVTAAEYCEFTDADNSESLKVELKNISLLKIKHNKANRFASAVEMYDLADHSAAVQLMLLSAIEHASQQSFVEVYDKYVGKGAAYASRDFEILAVLNQFDSAEAFDEHCDVMMSTLKDTMKTSAFASIFSCTTLGLAAFAVAGFFSAGAVFAVAGALAGLALGAGAGGLIATSKYETRKEITEANMGIEVTEPILRDAALLEINADTSDSAEFAFTPAKDLDFSGEPCSWTDSEESDVSLGF